MKKLYFVLFVAAIGMTACQKDFGERGSKPAPSATVSADFDWKTTRDVSISVGMPATEEGAPEFAVVRVFSSPLLNAANLLAKGVVDASSPMFRTAATIPASAAEIYVQTTLPDGTVSVRSAAIAEEVHFGGAQMKSVTPGIRLHSASGKLKASSMPADYPTLEPKTAADFTDPRTVIASTPAQMLVLGSGSAGAPAYLIPAGATVAGNLDLTGGKTPYKSPVLYVAGKLTLASSQIDQATLAVLDGGEVYIKEVGMKADNTLAIYVFKGGKFAAEDINISRQVVNFGAFEVADDIDAGNRSVIYNMPGATMIADEVDCSGNAVFFNDGTVKFKDLGLDSGAKFENCENGDATLSKCDLETGGTEFYQKGKAAINELENEGRFYVYCHTYAKEIEGDHGKFLLASGACLEGEIAELDNTDVNMAPSSLFIVKKYNADAENGNTKFTNDGNDEAYSVVRIEEKAVSRKGHHTDFKGPIEVVYDSEGLAGRYQLEEKSFKSGAHLVARQQVNIPATECNGGKGEIEPEPEEKPEAEYEIRPGRTFTYCFEDRWPWIGDYDMNDVVLETRIDREVSTYGGKVKSATINWALKAAGTQVKLGCGVQIDGMSAMRIAGVTSTHRIGAGAFAADGLETGSELAIIPLFNSTGELLNGSNTYPELPHVMPVTQTTKIEFAQPVEEGEVLESAMNFFITVGERGKEVHMPGYDPTVFGEIGDGLFDPREPYKFYVEKGEHVGDNYLMWALMIPDVFRYPAESKDIRSVYTHFMAWAASNGISHPDWYREEADESRLY